MKHGAFTASPAVWDGNDYGRLALGLSDAIAGAGTTIRRADQILVVEEGPIVERGNHAELFAMGGRYYDLYTRQHGLEANLFLAPGEGDLVPVE